MYLHRCEYTTERGCGREANKARGAADYVRELSSGAFTTVRMRSEVSASIYEACAWDISRSKCSPVQSPRSIFYKYREMSHAHASYWQNFTAHAQLLNMNGIHLLENRSSLQLVSQAQAGGMMVHHTDIIIYLQLSKSGDGGRFVGVKIKPVLAGSSPSDSVELSLEMTTTSTIAGA